MSAALTVYTTYDDIRAALGVSPEDLEDATLGTTTYADFLESELEDVNINLPATFATTKALGSPTAAQSRFLRDTRLFSTFALAKQLTSSLPLFAAKQLSDGKTTVQRFDNPYKDLVASITTQYDKIRNRLVQSLAAIGTSSTPFETLGFVAVSLPSTDRVTGL